MKEKIHPKYFEHAKVTCACGATYDFGSTKPEIHVEICAACHPVYTGTEKVLDAAGRVEKFKARKAAGATKAKKGK
ncbi:MAG: 50S ribosomal protein L31 [Patescibacteria group bacterium]|nr:50S ribosomal protein L31 [Patescibacteria group bacterium]MDE1946123.1 50S ribosomal protein L31 [Patescibacteria group bacterium]